MIAAFAFGAMMSNNVFAEEDPYLWLEEVMGEKAISWVRDQNAKSQKTLEASPQFAAIRDKALEVLNSRARIPAIVKRGNWYYNFWQDEKNVRGVWRRTTMEEYRKADPKWETVLDVDQLARDEKENWIWKGSSCLYPKYDSCLLSLSRGGADAGVIREFDVVAKSFVAGGFELKEAKGEASWIDRNTLFVQTDFGPGSLTKSGYPRIVKEWKRGTPLEIAKTVFEGNEADISVSGYQSEQKGYVTRQFVRRAVTFFTAELFLREGAKLTKLDIPVDAQASYAQDTLWVRLKSAWPIGGKTYSQGSLIAMNFERFMKGERNFEVLFEPTNRKSLAGWALTKSQLILNELDNVQNSVWEHSRVNGKWVRQSNVKLSGTMSISAIDADESDDYFVTGTGYLTPSALWLRTAGTSGNANGAQKLKSLPAFFDAAPYKVEQFEVSSKDGERIPYFMVMNNNTQFNGRNPTLLYGYGGFEVSQVPAYSATVGNAWLNNGGVYVVANIRGGGEFGPRWHQAGLKANRQKVFDDFIAVAEDLIAKKVTAPRHLAIYGGSNGGLLVGAVATQRPELFRAVICTVPLLDMKRYHKLLAGASWVAEYGNPDDPKEWEFISKYSPYQNVKAGVKYPKFLFVTSTRDDRVHPGHARKMVARMMEQGHDVMYYENIEGGHAVSANNQQLAYRTALQYSFLLNELK
ncbi:MAG: S9 family peptidase [Betaproteobacteria bacterium]|nr:S9 family peptidase [Betaproteobacteria bacterium]